MPRGVNFTDEARLQGRLWHPGGLVNILGSSHNLNASPWATFANGSGSISLTDNAGLAPDGTNTALLATINRSYGGDYAQIYQPITTTAVSYAFPIWVKAYAAADVGLLISLAMYSGTAGDLRGLINHPLTTRWQRPCPAAVMTSTSSAQANIGYLDGVFAPGPTTQSGQVQFLLWSAAVAPGTRAFPIRRTTTAGVTTASPGVLLATEGDKAEAYDLWQYGYPDALSATHSHRNRPPLIGS